MCPIILHQETTRYAIYSYLLQLGFHPVAVNGNLYKNRKGTAIYRKGEIIHKKEHKIKKTYSSY
jgi:hypothetical protein